MQGDNFQGISEVWNNQFALTFFVLRGDTNDPSLARQFNINCPRVAVANLGREEGKIRKKERKTIQRLP